MKPGPDRRERVLYAADIGTFRSDVNAHVGRGLGRSGETVGELFCPLINPPRPLLEGPLPAYKQGHQCCPCRRLGLAPHAPHTVSAERSTQIDVKHVWALHSQNSSKNARDDFLIICASEHQNNITSCSVSGGS